MQITLALLPEMILLGSGLLYLSLLSIWPIRTNPAPYTILGILSSLGSAVAAFFLREHDMEHLFGGALQFDPSFVFVRVCLGALTALVILVVGYSTQIDDRRKPEICFFVLWIALLASILSLSRHFLVSYICLFGIAILNSFLSASPFQRASEGRAALYYWFQSALCFTLGLGVLVVIAAQMDDLNYDGMRLFFSKQDSFLTLPMIVFLLLPFWTVSGLFPFNHATMELNHGSVWPVQAAQSLLVQGPVVLALFKVIVLVFFSVGAALSPFVLYGFSVMGFLGALAGGFGALSQNNGKRFAANFASMQWAICLVTIGNPVAFSISAVIFYYLSISIALAACFVIWGGLLDARKSDSLLGLRGARERCLLECLLLLAALVSLAGLPPFMGFQANLNILTALFDQRESVLLLLFIVTLILQLVVVGRMVGLLFFAEADDHDGMLGTLIGVGTKMRIALFTLIAPLFLLGFFGEGVWTTLLEKANSFINF